MTSDPGAQPPSLQLRRASATEYCRYARQARHNEVWWYFNGLAPYRRFSRPFMDDDGRWWFCVKPGFAWPVSFFETFTKPPRGLRRRLLLGWQYPVRAGGNSTVAMNVIPDLSCYGFETIAENKRRAVRKGLRELEVQVVDPADATVCEWGLKVWNSHVQRTGWNRAMEPAEFQSTWRELADWPGTTVLAAWPKADRSHFCGWLILRTIDDVVYIDTLASATDCMPNRPNDALIFAALCSARDAGVRRAHYSLKSDITSLEEFKQSLGFMPHTFPARLHLRFGVGTALRLVRPKAYERLLGCGGK